MSIEQKRAELVFGKIYNQVERIAANRHLSVHERLACALLESAICYASGEYDRITGSSKIADELTASGVHFEALNGTTNHIYMNRDMVGELVMAVNRNTMIEDHIHIIDSAGVVQVIAERHDKEAYPILNLPSIHIVNHKK